MEINNFFPGGNLASPKGQGDQGGDGLVSESFGTDLWKKKIPFTLKRVV